MVGTSGSSGERSLPVTASARSLPALTCGTVGGPSAIVIAVWPLMTARFISLLLLYGIATPGMPDFSFNNSTVMVKAGDDVAYLALSGCCFIHATISLRFLEGLSAAIVMIRGKLAIMPMGANVLFVW